MTLTLAPETEARLRAAAAQKGLAPEELIDVLLKQSDGTQFSAADAEQERLQNVFERLHVKALALKPESAIENHNRAPEEVQVGEIIVEKYRQQGFNL